MSIVLGQRLAPAVDWPAGLRGSPVTEAEPGVHNKPGTPAARFARKQGPGSRTTIAQARKSGK